MNTRRALFLGMILVQAVTTGLLAEVRLVPVLSAVAAIVVFVRPMPFRLTLKGQIYLPIALFIGFVLMVRLMPISIFDRFSPFPNDYNLNLALAYTLLVVQIFLLATRQFTERGPNSLWSIRYLPPFMGLVQLASVTDFISQEPLYRWTSMVSAVLFAALFCMWVLMDTTDLPGSRRGMGRPILAGVLLVLAFASGLTFAFVMINYSSRIDWIILGYLQSRLSNGSVGASERATLGSVSNQRDTNGQQVILRIEAEDSPGYLRGRIYDRFDGRIWHVLEDDERLEPSQVPEAVSRLLDDTTAFALRPSVPAPGHLIRIWFTSAPKGVLYTTLETAWMDASMPFIRVDAHRGCHADALPGGRHYYLVTGADALRDPVDKALLDACLVVPPTLTNEARAVATGVFEDATSTQEKIAAAVAYFQDHYQYHMGIEVPQGQDALSWFLVGKPPAHCEYFAAGVTALLRLGGVPCRYVTGFMVSERNPWGDYWVARNRDAHAWAEAWDEASGWVVVEATPGDGLPEARVSGSWEASVDALRFRLGCIWSFIHEEGMAGVMRLARFLVGWFLATWPGRVVLLLLAGGVLFVGGRRFRVRWPLSQEAPEQQRYKKLLRMIDAQARRKGYLRPPHETFHQFADRILLAHPASPWHLAASDWYRTCATLRCNGTPLPEVLDVLKEKADRCAQTTALS